MKKYKKDRYISGVITAIFAAAVILPVLTLFVWSFTQRWAWPYIIPGNFSLNAVIDVFEKLKKPGGILISGVVLSLITALLSVIIALMSAKALLFYNFLGRNALLFGSILPFIVPASVFSMGVQLLFINLGLNNTLHGVMIAHLIYSLPYALRLIMDAMSAIGEKYEEQARVLGACGIRAFVDITVPMLLPVSLTAFCMAYIISFSQYFLTLLIGGGRVITFTIIMVPYLTSGNRNFASAYSLVFLGISVIIFMLSKKAAAISNRQLKTQLY